MQRYLPDARPLSIVVTYDGKETNAQLVQAVRKSKEFSDIDTAVRNLARGAGISEEEGRECYFDFLKRAEYDFIRELFRITPDYEFVHDTLPLDEALRKFEFG